MKQHRIMTWLSGNRNRRTQMLVFFLVALFFIIQLSFIVRDDGCREQPSLRRVAVLTSKQLQRQIHHNISSQVFNNERRVIRTKDVCRRHPELMTSVSNGKLWVSPRYSLAFCVVPKVGCTHWKRLIKFIENDIEPDVKFPTDIDRYTVHYRGTKNVLHFQVDTPGHLSMVEPALKFMFTRDPYTRLWSAYLDKFYLPDFWCVGKDVLTEVRKTVSHTSRECGNDVTFEEFIRYIHIHRNDVTLNEHYTTVTFNCNPCKLKYDVIGKLETFKDDTDVILANVGLLDEIPEDPKLDRVLEEIHMLTDYNLDVQDSLVENYGMSEKCFDNFETCKRLWKVFQTNGYIGNDNTFPADEFAGLTERDEFKAKLKELTARLRNSAHKDTLNTWKAQRTIAVKNAYNNLPQDVLSHFKDFYSVDFEMFDYEPNPTWLKKDV